jgi:hypothetical protein
MSATTMDSGSVGVLLRALRLPSFVECYEEAARRGEA